MFAACVRFCRLLSRIAVFFAIGLPAAFAVTSASAAKPSAAHADYPVRSLRIIVASSPGAADDFFARALGEALGQGYQQRILVENRAGAGGLIGNRRVSNATADGYTLGMVGVTRIISELMRDEPPYHALGDIVGVAHVASITNVLVVSPRIPKPTAREFVTYARVRPGDLNYASLGIGSASHLAGEMFSRELGIDAVHIPFRKVTDSFVEMLLGRVHYGVLTLPAVVGQVLDGRLRALAVMTERRSAVLPQVPSIAEVGLPDAQFDSWSGIVVPRGTPRRIVAQLHGDIGRALRKAALRKVFVSQGAESTPDSTSEGFTRHMQEEYLRYQALIRDSGIKPE